MIDYGSYVSEGVDHLGALAPLLAFPVLLSFLNWSAIGSVLSHRGVYFGIAFPLPAPIGDLWTFVSLPSTESSQLVAVHGAGSLLPPSATALVLAGVLGYAVAHGIFVAAYLGSISQYRTGGSYDVTANVLRYGVRYASLSLVLFGVVVLTFPLLFVSPVFVLIAFPLVLLVSYLFWGAWFLVCDADAGTVDALRGSYRLATSERAYLEWSVFHLLVSALFSILVSGVVVNGGIVGILFGVVIAVPVGFVLTVASLSLIDDIAPSPR